MGEKTPRIWPPYDPEKWYLVNVKSYENGDGVCHDYLFDQYCCKSGQIIIDWLPLWCQAGNELCHWSTFTAQQIMNYEGPYDAVEECEDDLP